MDRRKIARRKSRLEEIREKEARLKRQRSEKAVREQEEEIQEMKRRHEEAEAQFSEGKIALDGAWLDVLERSRTVHNEAVAAAEEELEARVELQNEEVQKHIKTIEALRSSERVVEKVVDQWRDEEDRGERAELDEVAGTRASRET